MNGPRVALFALVLTACAGGDETPGIFDAGGRDGESSSDTGVDAILSVPDGGGGGGGEAIPAGPASSLADAEDPDGLVGDPTSCWDGLDNDEDLESDCDDPACALVPACGLGSVTRCAPESSASFTASSCGAEPATPGCLGISFTAFGSPGPWVIGDRLHPGGDDFDSGLVLDDAVAPRSRRIVMTGSFGELTCPAGTTCVEFVSFGITDTTSFGTSTRVHPTAVLQMSAARTEVALLIGGAVVDRWEFVAASPQWTLDLRPTGEILVQNGDTARLRVPYAPPATAAAVIYGRNLNRAEDEPGGAGLDSFSMSTSLCDIPDAWTSREPLVVVDPSGDAVDLTTLRAPSARRGGDGVLYLAFEVAGASGQNRILVAAQDGSDTRFALQHPADSQILSAADTSMGVTRIGDPELHWDDETSTWHLLFTGELGDERRIGHASGPDFASMAFTDWVVVPSGNVSGVEQPSVARSDDGRFILAVGTSVDGGRALDVYVGATVEGPYMRHDGSLASETLRGGAGRSGFDADEVGAPSLRVVGGAYHLYFAGRRGTRWGVGVWTSAELLYWRRVSRTEAILSGDGSGFDALGASDPEILVDEATAHLFYRGEDGNVSRLGVATRPGAELSP